MRPEEGVNLLDNASVENPGITEVMMNSLLLKPTITADKVRAPCVAPTQSPFQLAEGAVTGPMVPATLKGTTAGH